MFGNFTLAMAVSCIWVRPSLRHVTGRGKKDIETRLTPKPYKLRRFWFHNSTPRSSDGTDNVAFIDEIVIE